MAILRWSRFLRRSPAIVRAGTRAPARIGYDFGALPPAGFAGVAGDCGAAGSEVDGVDDGVVVDGVDGGGAAVDDPSGDGFGVAAGVVAGASVDDELGPCAVVGELLLVFVGGDVLGLLQPAASAHAAISMA